MEVKLWPNGGQKVIKWRSTEVKRRSKSSQTAVERQSNGSQTAETAVKQRSNGGQTVVTQPERSNCGLTVVKDLKLVRVETENYMKQIYETDLCTRFM